MLDNTRLRAELAHIHQTLSGVAAGARGKALVDEIRREVGGTTPALLWQSLFADCLRVAYSAVAADGKIGDDEVEALYEFVFSVARHYAAALPSSYGEFAAIDEESVRAFLDRYAADHRPFGRGANRHWPGLTLCRRAAELGEPEALERYERMMTWLISAVCQVGGVTEADPRWRGRVDELDELRRTLARDAVVEPSDVDLRLQAFLSPSRIFASVEQVASVFEPDPFDVETIHERVRASFKQMVDRATTPAQHTNRGRMLLMLGDSGAGKTHLLRGFRQHVHEYGHGFVAYAQMHSSSDDYARYLLQHVVHSLARPYAGPSGERTGLHELASGLPRLVGGALKARLARLSDDDWDSSDSLAEYVNHLVDDLLEQSDLASFDPDLLRVLLYALYPQHRTTSRVYKYLLCENMNAHDRRWIGDVVPRTDKGDPVWMIRQLARLAFVTQQAALVLMVDQAELAGFEAASITAFRRAIDTLNSIVSEVPSAIAVVACLSDLYYKARGELNKSAIDRLENDPPLERLDLNRSYPEIEALVGRRLSWLFADVGAVYRPETPVYPIPEAHLRRFSGRRTRAILEWCHKFQAECAAAGRIVEIGADQDVGDLAPAGPLDLDQIAAAWNDAMHAPNIEIPDDDEEILAVIGTAAKACADEAGLVLVTPPRKNGVLRLTLGGVTETAELAIAVTNHGYQRGAFGKVVEALRKSAGRAIPVAIRTLEFPRGEACDNVVAKLLKAGGRRAYVDASTLRALAAYQRFQPAFPEARVAAWRRRDRPISTLPPMAHIFDLGRLCPEPATEAGIATSQPASPAASADVTSKSEAARPVARPVADPAGLHPARGRSEWAPTATVARRAASVAGSPSTNGGAKGADEQSTSRDAGDTTPGTNGASRVATAASAADQVAATSMRASSTAGTRLPDRPGMPASAAVEVLPAATTAAAPVVVRASLRPDSPATRTTSAPNAAPTGDAATLRIGTASGFHAAPRTIEIASLLRHTGILGSPGSGKTTLALNLIEQALERDVSVVLVDRKGDLAGYANPDWWKSTSDPVRARRLADRIDVRLFTPGTRGGRPLSLSVVPDLENIPEHERDRLVQYAANALAAMMRINDAGNGSARRAILTQAISLLAGRSSRGGLIELIAMLEDRDDELIDRAGRYDDRLFKRLVQDLETVRLSDADLFDPAAEPLAAETLLGRAADGRIPLTIASTRFLGDVERIQSWVAHLIACLSRHAARSPSAELHTVFMIDEADLFMPAGAAKPPSKEPLQDLLRRARAAGLGVMLASQSPADFDYRSREQINTWFLGRIADRRSIDKMKPLFEHRPAVGSKLGTLEAGRFVLLQDGGAADIDRTPSLLRTEQLSEDELMALAAHGRARR